MEQSLIKKSHIDESTVPHRNLFSHMVLSHIAIVVPCIWWLFGYNSGTYISLCR